MSMRVTAGFIGLASVAGLLALSPTPIAAQDMNGEALYQSGKRLEAMGARALLDPDAYLLRREADAAIREARERNRRAATPAFCLPESGHDMTAGRFLDEIERIPEERRRVMTSTQIVTQIFSERYPCRG